MGYYVKKDKVYGQNICYVSQCFLDAQIPCHNMKFPSFLAHVNMMTGDVIIGYFFEVKIDDDFRAKFAFFYVVYCSH
jgi:hypothetical protein